MNETQVQRFIQDPENLRLFQQERLILEITARLCHIMENKGVSRKELAERLGTSKGYITQLLDGRANMTLRKIADVFAALGEAVELTSKPVESTVRPIMTICEAPANWRKPAQQAWSQPIKVVEEKAVAA